MVAHTGEGRPGAPRSAGLTAGARGRSVLGELARLYGVQTSYTDVFGKRRSASDEAVVSVLGILGAPLSSPSEAAPALRERRAEDARPSIPPVVVAWDGRPCTLQIKASRARLGRAVSGTLRLEGGGEAGVGGSSREAPSRDGIARVAVRLPRLPLGYHELSLDGPGLDGTTLVIAAPTRCPDVQRRLWGAFLPLYAARSRGNWGVGDFSDLGSLRDWSAGLGAGMFGTLPLLAALLDDPFEPSPYSPASRLFWNELFIDVEAAPELEGSPEARGLVASAGFRRELARLRRAKLVDYRAVAALKRRALELLAGAFRDPSAARRSAFDRFRAARPEVQDYARFRAAAEHFAGPWQRWPVGARNRRLTARVAEPDAVDRHVYIQWLAEEQLERAASRGRTGEGLYLDLPLGVHESGYDTWRHREEFALGASGGAPPDMFFTKGQDWGFPPLHPRGIREGRHGYFIAAVRNLLRHAGALRIDHVMGLHRLFWVPRGMDAREGMYVRYPAEELYAILTLEAHRTGALVVGEDLGTVPRYVRRAMERHGVLRSYVLELETLDPERPLPEPPELSLATLGTHDMPPFAAFIEGLDVDDRVDQGLLNADQTNTERAARERQRRALAAALRERRLLRGPSPGAAAGPLTDAGHRYLATSPARMAVVNLEDLWGETEPQNRPGTGAEQPNWRRKASRSLEQLRDDPEVVDRLREVDRARRGGTAKAARSERPPPRTSPTRKGRQ